MDKHVLQLLKETLLSKENKKDREREKTSCFLKIPVGYETNLTKNVCTFYKQKHRLPALPGVVCCKTTRE